MRTLPTPLIESALSVNPRLAKFLQAKNELLQGLADQKILNVVFQDAKDQITRSIEAALPPTTSEWVSIAREIGWDHPFIGTAWEDVSQYGSLNQFSGRVKRLTKWIKIGPPQELLEATQAVIAIYEEAAQFHPLINELKPFIVKGRRPSENPTEVDLTNTGICPICDRRIKLNGGHMVDHGFTISRGDGRYLGYRSGKCFGVGFRAYELSNEGNVAYAPVLASYLKASKDHLSRLLAGEIESFSRDEDRYFKDGVRCPRYTEQATYPKGTVIYEQMLDSAILSTERDIRIITMDIETNSTKIATWVAQPLLYGSK